MIGGLWYAHHTNTSDSQGVEKGQETACCKKPREGQTQSLHDFAEVVDVP